MHGKGISGSTLNSCLHLVDLASSELYMCMEKIYSAEVTGDALKETRCINKYLSCLEDVITALAQKNSPISYRN